MKLLLIRHAIAENREVFSKVSKNDEKRPLIAKGRKRMKKNLIGIKKLLPRIDKIVSSPLVRTRQTADMMLDYYKSCPLDELEALKPGGDLSKVFEYLKAHRSLNVLAMVGHSPDLGDLLAAALVGGRRSSFISLRKGGICLLEFTDKIDRGRASLLYMLQPPHLAAYGSSSQKDDY